MFCSPYQRAWAHLRLTNFETAVHVWITECINVHSSVTGQYNMKHIARASLGPYTSLSGMHNGFEVISVRFVRNFH